MHPSGRIISLTLLTLALGSLLWGQAFAAAAPEAPTAVQRLVVFESFMRPG